jgi:hypothetical protein
MRIKWGWSKAVLKEMVMGRKEEGWRKDGGEDDG